MFERDTRIGSARIANPNPAAARSMLTLLQQGNGYAVCAEIPVCRALLRAERIPRPGF
jgi:hypothetical protein